jgi:hypothetical protein
VVKIKMIKTTIMMMMVIIVIIIIIRPGNKKCYTLFYYSGNVCSRVMGTYKGRPLAE